MKPLLVVVDMQIDFISGALGTKEAETNRSSGHTTDPRISGRCCIYQGYPRRRLLVHTRRKAFTGRPLYQRDCGLGDSS